MVSQCCFSQKHWKWRKLSRLQGQVHFNEMPSTAGVCLFRMKRDHRSHKSNIWASGRTRTRTVDARYWLNLGKLCFWKKIRDFGSISCGWRVDARIASDLFGWRLLLETVFSGVESIQTFIGTPICLESYSIFVILSAFDWNSIVRPYSNTHNSATNFLNQLSHEYQWEQGLLKPDWDSCAIFSSGCDSRTGWKPLEERVRL